MTMWLSRIVILFIAFMFTPAFKGLLIMMAILFDAFTTSLGLAPLVFKRMGLAIKEGNINIQYAAYFAIGICIFFAVLLVCSIAVSMFHKKGWQNKVLGIASMVISFKGVCGDAYDNIHSIDDVTFSLCIDSFFYLAFAIAPVIYVSMNSGLIISQFASELKDITEAFNLKLTDWLRNVINKRMDTANTILAVETDKQQQKAESKAPRKPKKKTGPKTESYKQEEKSTVTIEDIPLNFELN